MVDRSVDALIECTEQHMDSQEVVFMLLTSLMKLAVRDMTTRHNEIKALMVRVEGSSDFLTHSLASGMPNPYDRIHKQRQVRPRTLPFRLTSPRSWDGLPDRVRLREHPAKHPLSHIEAFQ